MALPKSSDRTLALLALGVVYGDIGTSPIYALRECMARSAFDTSAPIPELLVLGPVSLLIWSLTIIVTLKYILLLNRADNQGQGGIFALYALLRRQRTGLGKSRLGMVLAVIALLGASLLYGDGMITPAISVLSAVEGLRESQPLLRESWTLPLVAAGILLALFLFQRRGPGRIGAYFGPFMLLWFLVLGGLGLFHVLDRPQVLRAFLPHYGGLYLWSESANAIHIMGTALLAVAGCEVLYADLGNVGRRAMNISWFGLVFPALLLNYLGQGALILKTPSAYTEPFYRMIPAAWLAPMVILATGATIIASQAMITGVFALTLQATHLNFLPRLKVVHTNAAMRGQVYLPQVNRILMVASLGLVLGFRSSSALANAYGLSVASSMIITSALFFLLTTQVWHWPMWKAAPLCGLFLLIEMGYLVGGLSKFLEGAWFPLAVALGAWLMMKTWRDGRAILMKRVVRNLIPLPSFVEELRRGKIMRVPGIGVFLSSSTDGLPLVLLHHLKHNKVLHETAVLLTVRFEEDPLVSQERRLEVIELLPNSLLRVIVRYGFAESPDVMRDLCQALREYGITKLNDISFYQSRELLMTDGTGKMATWRKKLFVFLSRVSRPATGYFRLPSRQVIELGIQLDL